MKTKIFSMLAGTALIAAGCSSEVYSPAEEGQDSRSEGMAFTVSFGGSIANAPSATRAYHTDAEKKVTSLYAVLFQDTTVEEGLKNGTPGTEDNDNDKYMVAVNLLSDGSALEENKLYSIDVPENGHYQVCFVANPSEDLARQISGFGYKTGTVAQFKALLAEQKPEGDSETTEGTPYGFLMTSKFYAVNIDGWKEDIGKVNLTRAMARIDIQNLNPEITVTKVEFQNRAVKSLLYNDNSTAVSDKYLDSSKAYECTLVGNESQTATENVLTSTIYSYEQNSTAKAPQLVITYNSSVLGEEGNGLTKTIDFKKSDDSAIALQRNHLYRVRITAAAGMQVIVDVADWDEGETFAVDNSDIANNADPSTIITDKYEARFGDFILADGRIAKNDEKFRINPLNKPVAMVVYALAQEDGYKNEGTRGAQYRATSMNTVLQEKNGEGIHGIAMALQYAVTSTVNWRKVNQDVKISDENPYPFTGTNFGDVYDKPDGLAFSDYVKRYWETNKSTLSPEFATEFPAFGKVEEYASRIKAPDNTTGWYLPSMGELVDMMGNAGLDLASCKASEDWSDNFNFTFTPYLPDKTYNTARNKINEKLSAAKYDAQKIMEPLYSGNDNKWLWTSTKLPDKNISLFNPLQSDLTITRSSMTLTDPRGSIRAFLAY